MKSHFIKMQSLILILTFVLLFPSCIAVSVGTKHANLAGFYDPSFDTDVFIGIPYAQPPVGSLRLQPPLPIDKDQGDVNVTGPISNRCFEIEGTLSFAGSEDCLNLDLVRPTSKDSGSFHEGVLLPVYVFIHGLVMIILVKLGFG
jgi:triacylglycerol lipase